MCTSARVLKIINVICVPSNIGTLSEIHLMLVINVINSTGFTVSKLTSMSSISYLKPSLFFSLSLFLTTSKHRSLHVLFRSFTGRLPIYFPAHNNYNLLQMIKFNFVCLSTMGGHQNDMIQETIFLAISRQSA